MQVERHHEEQSPCVARERKATGGKGRKGWALPCSKTCGKSDGEAPCIVLLRHVRSGGQGMPSCAVCSKSWGRGSSTRRIANVWNVVWSCRMIGNIYLEFQTSSSSDCSIPTRQCIVGVRVLYNYEGKASINAHNPIGILVTYNKSHILSDPPSRTHVHLNIHD